MSNTVTPRNTGGLAGDTAVDDRIVGPGGRAALVALRIGLGLTFLWAFLDKAFGLGYSTPGARAWINGGSPTKGFLSNVDFGPLKSFFVSIAGNPVTDWLFMLSLLGLGIALIFGAGLRIAAVAGTILMLMMWAAEWPLARFTEAGEATGSTNPLIDYHIIYALGMIVVAALNAGDWFGLGRWWGHLPFVRKNTWLR